MNGRQEVRMGIGVSSALMIFVVLCLTTLGVLAFASARADLSLTQRRQAQVEAYYAAASQAQRVLADIDAALLAARRAPEGYEAAVRGLALPGVTVTEDLRLSFALPAGNRQHLVVALQAGGPEDAPRYQLTRHQLVYTADWEPEAGYWVTP